MKKLKLIVAALLTLSSSALLAQSVSDQSTRLTDGWMYAQQDMGGIWEILRAPSKKPSILPHFEKVTLPHCFNAYDALDPDVVYYEGPGWYRTELEINNPYEGGRTLLHFEGAGQKTQLYVGDQMVGNHVGGYDEWSVDITESANKALQNAHIAKTYKGLVPVSVRCDNSRDLEMIPSDLSDFNIYGGLYRYVNLVYLPANYISQVHFLPQVASKKSGTVNVKISSVGDAPFDATISVKNPSGEEVYTTTINDIKGSAEHNFSLKKIALWSPDAPQLYAVTIETSEGQTYRDNFGFREFRFEEKGPFYLNGERLLLRGTHRHEDAVGLGAAMTEEMTREEMILMKEMGVNFIRLGHYQQSRTVLNLCDSLGILAWEEVHWCRGGVGGDKYKDQARTALTNMIAQHYNHPSIIIWGLGNENDWPGDFNEFDKEKIRGFMSELHNLSHKLDDTRKTAIRRCAFCSDIVDVYSPSLWAGWYRGELTNYKNLSHQEMSAVSHFLHVEYGGSSHASRHNSKYDKGIDQIKVIEGAEGEMDTVTNDGDAIIKKDTEWSETYICNVFDWHLKEQLRMPWLTGAAQWAFKDFSTPVRPENPVPYMNQKGVVERDLTKKESYYVFQSYWTEKPMAHIYGHTWEVRWGDVDEEQMVKVYSNCTSAELFVNGVSQGVKERDPQNFPAAGLRWMAKFNDGDNHLKVVARKGKEVITDETSFFYQTEKWGTPTKLRLKEIARKGNIVTVEATIYDENGVFCPDAINFVRFGSTGETKLIDNLGTAAGSRKVGMANGRAIISIEMLGDTGVASVTSEGVDGAILIL